MNRVGEGGRGESVWLGWLLLRDYRPLRPVGRHVATGRARAAGAPMPPPCARRSSARPGTATGIAARRSTTAPGSVRRRASECRIDSIAQSWAVLSGAPIRRARPRRWHRSSGISSARTTVSPSCSRRRSTQTPRDPGYIKGYPPGLRENGGQYSHAAMWAILAFAKLGDGDKAVGLFCAAQPDQPRDDTRRRSSATRSSPTWSPPTSIPCAPHVGAAAGPGTRARPAWMYRAGVEGIRSAATSFFAASLQVGREAWQRARCSVVCASKPPQTRGPGQPAPLFPRRRPIANATILRGTTSATLRAAISNEAFSGSVARNR